MTDDTRTDQRMQRGQRTRARLIEEGMRLFALKGFEAVPTRELASASDANVAAIHFHFGGKAGLYEAVIADVADRLARIYAEAVSGGDTSGAPTEAGRIGGAGVEAASFPVPRADGRIEAEAEQDGPESVGSAARVDGSDESGHSPAAKSARAMVSRMIVSLLATRRSRWMSLLLQREFINPTEGFGRIFETALRPVLEALSEAVQAVTGAPREDFDNRTLAFGIFVLVSAFSRNRTLFLHWTGREEYGPEDAARIGDILAEFVLTGLAGSDESGGSGLA